MSEKNQELLGAVDEDRRGLLKKILMGGATVYVAPVIASFSLSESFAATSVAYASNQPDFRCHPTGNGGRVVPNTPGHIRHGDDPVDYPDAERGDPCEPDDLA